MLSNYTLNLPNWWVQFVAQQQEMSKRVEQIISNFAQIKTLEFKYFGIFIELNLNVTTKSSGDCEGLPQFSTKINQNLNMTLHTA